MERFVQGLLHGLKAPLAESLLQDAFLFWLKFDRRAPYTPAGYSGQFHVSRHGPQPGLSYACFRLGYFTRPTLAHKC